MGYKTASVVFLSTVPPLNYSFVGWLNVRSSKDRRMFDDSRGRIPVYWQKSDNPGDNSRRIKMRYTSCYVILRSI